MSCKQWQRQKYFWTSVIMTLDPMPCQIRGYIKRGWWRRVNYMCLHCFLWPVTIQSWWKPSSGQADQLHTTQHSPRTCIHKWREGMPGRYLLRYYLRLWSILPKERQPGDKHSNTDVGQWVPQIKKINTANKSAESCWVPNRKKKRSERVYLSMYENSTVKFRSVFVPA